MYKTQDVCLKKSPNFHSYILLQDIYISFNLENAIEN